MKTSSASVNDYIASLPDTVRSDIQVLDQEISAIMQGGSRKLWVGAFWGGTEQTIIGYGDLSYTRSDKQHVEWFVIGLALQKNYISIYVSMYSLKQYPGDLGKVKTGASNISIKQVSDLNMVELRKLLKIVATQAA